MSEWSTWVARDVMERRASARRRLNRERRERMEARRDQVRALVERWGLTPATRVKLARLFKVSLRTISRDLAAVQERPAIPDICPLCHLPSRLDLDPSTLTEDPEAVAAMERAMARLVGVTDEADRPQTRPKRPQPHDRPAPRGQTLARDSTVG